MCLAAAALALAPSAWAANAVLNDTDPNVEGLGFGRTDPFVFGAAYSQNPLASLNGNEFLAQTQMGIGGNAGAGFSVPISNGENGRTQSLDGIGDDVINPDIDNPTPPNSVFTTIGNAGGKLANGNVIRWSTWVRINPDNPVTVAPQIEPVFKFEFWKEALSNFADTNGGQAQPTFGDKIVDTDQHLAEGIWIDLDNNGTAIDGGAAGTGRLKTISTSAWTLIEVVHTVNDATWVGIDNDAYTVADVEEIRSVMFWGDFTSTSFAADGADGGTLWFDNMLVEVFANTGAVTPNTNPNPTLSEGGPVGDYDDDGDVDARDLAEWSRSFSIPDADASADADTDSDGADFLAWQRGLGSAPIGAVPEPGAIALGGVGARACGRGATPGGLRVFATRRRTAHATVLAWGQCSLGGQCGAASFHLVRQTGALHDNSVVGGVSDADFAPQRNRL